MSNDKLILELFSRIKNLEEDVEILKSKMNHFEKSPEENDDSKETLNQTEKVTRRIARKFVIRNLQLSNVDLVIEKGNRASGADIILKANKEKIKAKFFYSKNHRKEYIFGWHNLKTEDLANEEIKLYIFTVSNLEDFHTFIFTKKELKDFLKDKSNTDEDTYYFYFIIKPDKVVEVRDREEEKDCRNFYNTWSLKNKF